MSAYRRDKSYAGVGFVFSGDDDLMGVDVDDCLLPDGTVSATGQQALRYFGASYCEVSPSGTGLKFIIRGSVPGAKSGRKNPALDVEVYQAGRYFTLTGRRWPGSPTVILDKQDDLNQWCAEVFPTAKPPEAARAPAVPASATVVEIIERASTAAHGDRFRQLWAGDCSRFADDQSSADLALTSMLAFWTGPDPKLIDACFRASGLMRPKWERQDYRDATIQKALEGRTDFYQWGRNGSSAGGTPPAGGSGGSGGSLSGTGSQKNTTGRPVLLLSTDEKTVNDAVVSSLAGRGDLYDFSGELAAVTVDAAEPSRKVIRRLPLPILRETIAQTIRFESREPDAQGRMRSRVRHVPKWCYEAIHRRGQWSGIPSLRGIVNTPVLRQDGTIVQVAGFDAASGLFLDLPQSFPEVPERPTGPNVRDAVAMLLDLVTDFPFGNPASQAAWLAAVLTPLSREAHSGCTGPMFLFDANVRGSGKSLLSDLVSIIATGRDAVRMSVPQGDDEARKRITALAANAERLILLDNIAGKFGCESLDSALTATHWKDRILGRTEVVEGALRITWLATGNNVQLGADTARRTCHIRLESDLENPEDRQGFRYPDIRRAARERRPELLAAALTVLRGYIAAGRPNQGLTPWGSFESWSDLVRAAVVWAGLPDPGETRAELRKTSDNEVGALRQVLTALRLVDPGGHGLRTSDMLKVALGRDQSHSVADADALREALETLAESGIERINSRKLGNRLGLFRSRVVDGVALNCRVKGGTNFWVVRPVGGSGGSGGSVFDYQPVLKTESDEIIFSQRLKTDPPDPPDPPTATVDDDLAFSFESDGAPF